jgi:hypothetical protein
MKQMFKQKHRAIVNTSAARAFKAFPEFSAYNIIKIDPFGFSKTDPLKGLLQASEPMPMETGYLL